MRALALLAGLLIGAWLGAQASHIGAPPQHLRVYEDGSYRATYATGQSFTGCLAGQPCDEVTP